MSWDLCCPNHRWVTSDQAIIETANSICTPSKRAEPPQKSPLATCEKIPRGWPIEKLEKITTFLCVDDENSGIFMG